MKKWSKHMFFVVWLFSGTVFAANLTTQLANTKVPFGESFDFTISYDGDDGSILRPDLSVLQDDFTIYSTSSRMQSRYVNGVIEQKHDWIVSLMPKKEGKVTIPSITVGNYKTKPIDIEVADADDVVVPSVQNDTQQGDQGQREIAANFSLNLETENITPFVQQEFNAVLTLEDNKGIDITSEPIFEDSSDWIIKVLDKPEVINQNGKRTIKFFYALFAQKSGQLQLPVAQVDGSYLSFENEDASMQQTRSFFDMFNFDIAPMFGMRKPVHLVTKPKMVYVKPIPEESKNYWWLPATSLKLTAKWSDEKPIFRVGEAVSREIVLTASGVIDNQLPDFVFTENPALKQYPEKPQFETTVRDGQVVSKMRVRIVYIPQKSGRQTIPEITMPWYNTVTNRIETARILPEDMVIGGNDMPVKKEPNKDKLKVEHSDRSAESRKESQISTITRKIKGGSDIFWLILAFVAGIVVSLLMRRSGDKNSSNGVAFYVRKIEQNLNEQDYRSLKDNLLAWGKQFNTELAVHNLDDLAKVIDNHEFTKQMEIINSILYAGSTDTLNNDVILQCIKVSSKKSKTNNTSKPLPDLYK